MTYSASMVSCLFWLQETRKTAELMDRGLSLTEIRGTAVTDNIYQVRAADRAVRIAGATHKRISALPEPLQKKFLSADITTAKMILLLAIMKTDLLFYEFMHTVFKQAVVLGESTLSDGAVNVFFDTKISSSDEIASWSESAIKKLKQTYIKVLVESGVLSSVKERKIITPMIDYKLQDDLNSAGLLSYLSTLTGDDVHE